MIITGAVQVKWVMPTFDQTKHEASPFAIPSVNFSNMFDLILAQLIKMQNLEFKLLNSDESINEKSDFENSVQITCGGHVKCYIEHHAS